MISSSVILEFILGSRKIINLDRGWVIKKQNYCNEKFGFYPQEALAILSREVIWSFLGGFIVVVWFLRVISSTFVENRPEFKALKIIKIGLVGKCPNNGSKSLRGHELDYKSYKCIGGICLCPCQYLVPSVVSPSISWLKWYWVASWVFKNKSRKFGSKSSLQREENEFVVVLVNSAVAMGHLTRSVLRMDYFSLSIKLVGFTVSPLF